MNKFSFLFLASFASTVTLANAVDAISLRLSAASVEETKEVSINTPSAIDRREVQAEDAIYDYAENVFIAISDNIEEEFLNKLEQKFAVRISIR